MGRPKSEKTFANMLRVAIAEAHEGGGNRLRAVADALVVKAISGDVPAIREIADRLDGKPAQETTLTVERVPATQLSDDELANIAAGSGGGDTSPPLDPSLIN